MHDSSLIHPKPINAELWDKGMVHSIHILDEVKDQTINLLLSKQS